MLQVMLLSLILILLLTALGMWGLERRRPKEHWSFQMLARKDLSFTLAVVPVTIL